MQSKPEFDMDGCYFEDGDPTPEDEALYLAQQKQEDEWIKAGKCRWCGGGRNNPSPYCNDCLEENLTQKED